MAAEIAMHEEDMVAALRARGYSIRKKPTGFFILRYMTKKPHWNSKEVVQYSVRRTLRPAPGISDNVPKDAEIAEVDLSKLDWKPFWPADPVASPNARRKGKKPK